MKKRLLILCSLIFWIAVWEVISLLLGKDLLLPSPFTVFERLFGLCTQAVFWKSVATSLLRVTGGLLAGMLAGIITAVLTAKSSVLKTALSTVLHIIKATPVASFIILAILWLSASWVPAFTAMLIVIPTVWASTEKGIESQDPKLYEMGKAFGLSKTELFTRITVPSIKPFFIAALNSTVGMAWKAGIAAEVIVPYKNSIGTALYDSKINVETVDTFAWTLAVIILSAAFEKLIIMITEKGGKTGA